MSLDPVRQRTHRRRAFSLIELVIVVVILGTVVAIAIPRLARGAEGADVAALWSDFAGLNRAVELYTIEHGGASPEVEHIVSQLTMYSNHAGDKFGAAEDAASGLIYGPYLHAIPPVALGPNAGDTAIDTNPAKGIGWLYTRSRRVVRPNLQTASGDIPPGILNKLGIKEGEEDQAFGSSMAGTDEAGGDGGELDP